MSQLGIRLLVRLRSLWWFICLHLQIIGQIQAPHLMSLTATIFTPQLHCRTRAPTQRCEADTFHLIPRIKTVTFGLWYIQGRTSHGRSWKAAEPLWSSEDVSSPTANLLCPSHVLSPLVHSRFFSASPPCTPCSVSCSAHSDSLSGRIRWGGCWRVEGVSTLEHGLSSAIRPANYPVRLPSLFLFFPLSYPRTD